MNKVPIISRNNITLYGKIVDVKTKKLGQYEVYTPYSPDNGITYATFKEAERRFNELDYIAEKQGSEGLRLHFKKQLN